MRPTATLCHTRAAHHRGLASAAGLDNVRTVELAAAAAWDKEAVLAERREARADAGILTDLGDGADDVGVQRNIGPECD